MATPSRAKKLRVLNLNTNLYYDQDKLTKGMVDPADQFRWLEDRLIEAKKKNESVSAVRPNKKLHVFRVNLPYLKFQVNL